MTITLNELSIAKNAIAKLLNQDLPLKASYKLSKLVDQLNEEYDRIHEIRKKLMLKYGKKDEEKIEVLPDKVDEFKKELNEFLKEEVEISFDPMPLEVLGESAQLTSMEMRALQAFFVE